MTDRLTADTINSDALDQLYADLARYEEVLGELNETLVDRAKQAARAEAAIARVRSLAALWAKRTDQLKRASQLVTAALNDEPLALAGLAAPGPAATQATEAVRQMDADTTDPHTGLVVQPYRDHGEQKWVFRCWGTDTCDGWLSLDHYSEQSAERARDRHAAEEHGAPGPTATEEQDLARALGGDRTAQTIAHTLTVHGHTLNAVRTMTYAELLAVPGIGGTSLARIRAALDGVPEPEAAATTMPAGEYERTTGHAITCTAGFTDTCTCPPKEQH